jgi:hypothetical protein
MYRIPAGTSFTYKCAAYMQSHGERCDHNKVDGAALTRFALACIAQKVASPAVRAKLEARLTQLAKQELSGNHDDTQLTSKQSQLAQVELSLTKTARNLALADDEMHHRAIAEVYNGLLSEKAALKSEIQSLGKTSHKRPATVKSEVEAALARLNHLADLVTDPENLLAAGEAIRQVNLRVFLSFKQVQVKKRKLNKVAGGVVTFGSTPPPVPLYTGPTGRRNLKANIAALVAAGPEGTVSLPDRLCDGGKGQSLGNVNRGDRI